MSRSSESISNRNVTYFRGGIKRATVFFFGPSSQREERTGRLEGPTSFSAPKAGVASGIKNGLERTTVPSQHGFYSKSCNYKAMWCARVRRLRRRPRRPVL